MATDTREIQRILKTIAGGARLEILRFLKRRRSATVSQIAEHVGRSVKTVSNHLIRLSLHGIVIRRQRGRLVTYRLAVPQKSPVREILKLL